MKKLLIIGAFLLAGCQTIMPYEPVVDNRTDAQRMHDNCLKYFGADCTEEQKKQIPDLLSADFNRALDEYKDKLDQATGSGKYATMHAIEENTQRINDNLLWMRIENGMRR